MKWDGTLSDSQIDDLIIMQQEKYGTGTNNPAILTRDEAKRLMSDGLASYRETAQGWASDTGKSYSSNQIDALTSHAYNGTDPYSTNNLTYYFLEQDEQGGIDVIQKAVNEGWYEGNEGRFRRRLMEQNIFYNDDYTYYDSNESEMDELKNKVGYPGD